MLSQAGVFYKVLVPTTANVGIAADVVLVPDANKSVRTGTHMGCMARRVLSLRG